LSGTKPDAQLPLITHQQGAAIQIPLKANDCQDVFRVLFDLLKLMPEEAQEHIPAFQGAMEPAIVRLDKAILECSESMNRIRDY
jgi:hypothetical protein